MFSFIFVSRLAATALILVMIACSQTVVFASNMHELSTAWSAGRFSEAIRDFNQLPASEQAQPTALFFAGASYFRIHDLQRAKLLLQRATSGGMEARQAQNAQTILAHIQTLERLRPQFQKSYREGGFTINFYAGNSAWSSLLAAQMPQFFQRAREAFGDETADIDFYLFNERTPYDDFFSAWRTDDPPPEKHRGTGLMHMVEFCKFFPDGTEIGAGNLNDLYSRLLHEYSHALCNTIYGDRFGWNCPQWLNEGMADYFGWKYRPELYAQQSRILQKVALRIPAPSYEQLSRHFYEINNGYLIGNVLVLELLKDKDVSCFRNIISTAKSNGGNFEAAVQQVTGKDPKVVYASLVRSYWR